MLYSARLPAILGLIRISRIQPFRTMQEQSLYKDGSLNGGLYLRQSSNTTSSSSGSMTTLLDHRTTLAYLAHLGYPGEPRTNALIVTRPRKPERRKGKVSRNVFLCYICGAAGSGKTSLLRAFASKPYREAYIPTTKPISVVNSVEISGSEKYLVVSTFAQPRDTRSNLVQLQEFGSLYEAEALRNSKKTETVDVIVYVYDSSDTNSFSYISNLRVRVKQKEFGYILINSSATIFSRSHTDTICSHQVGFGPCTAGGPVWIFRQEGIVTEDCSDTKYNRMSTADD